MRKKLVNEKRDELKQMPREAFIDRILDYPDQNSLNRDSGNRKRDFPVGKVAEGIRDKGYEMSDKQYYALIHDFAEITVPNMKVAGSSQFKLGEDGPMLSLGKTGPWSIRNWFLRMAQNPHMRQISSCARPMAAMSW